MTNKTLIFDLDGTLIDTAPDLLDSLNHSLDIAGVDQADPSRLRGFVGHGARVMIERAFAAQNKPLSDSLLDELFGVFLKHYAGNMPGKSLPFDGVLDTISRFQEAGYVLAICTNKLESLAIRLIEALQMNQHFAVITGADTFAFRKPDPRHLTETIRLAGGDPKRSVLIGDSATDIKTGLAARVPVVAVDFGYSDKHVETYGPTRIISHFDEMTTVMADELIGVA